MSRIVIANYSLISTSRQQWRLEWDEVKGDGYHLAAGSTSLDFFPTDSVDAIYLYLRREKIVHKSDSYGYSWALAGAIFAVLTAKTS